MAQFIVTAPKDRGVKVSVIRYRAEQSGIDIEYSRDGGPFYHDNNTPLLVGQNAPFAYQPAHPEGFNAVAGSTIAIRLTGTWTNGNLWFPMAQAIPRAFVDHVEVAFTSQFGEPSNTTAIISYT